jgi:2-polyprenyl-6-methoxyphenol hydroxylase-like FAD-dependent oxidoreductase
LIGDAAHPMTPFKAQGANQALSDAVLLADMLVDSINKYGPDAGIDAALPLPSWVRPFDSEPIP